MAPAHPGGTEIDDGGKRSSDGGDSAPEDIDERRHTVWQLDARKPSLLAQDCAVFTLFVLMFCCDNSGEPRTCAPIARPVDDCLV